MADEPDNFMKRAKDVINLLIVASLCWLGMAVQQSTTQIAVLSEQIRQLQQQVLEAKGNAADRYTSANAASDFRSRDTEIAQSVNRLDSLEKRIHDLEMSSVARHR